MNCFKGCCIWLHYVKCVIMFHLLCLMLTQNAFFWRSNKWNAGVSNARDPEALFVWRMRRLANNNTVAKQEYVLHERYLAHSKTIATLISANHGKFAVHLKYVLFSLLCWSFAFDLSRYVLISNKSCTKHAQSLTLKRARDPDHSELFSRWQTLSDVCWVVW